MSLQRFAAGLSAVILAGWAVTASAAGEYGRSGPYLAAGGVYAFENIDKPGAPLFVDDVDNSWGYNVRGGYRFNKYFALEAEWEQWIGFDYTPALAVSLPDNAGFEGWLLSANAKFFLSDGPFQPYLLAGAGWMGGQDKARLDGSGNSLDDTDMGVRFGAGLDFYFSRNWGMNAEVGYAMGVDTLNDYQLIPISFGVFYRFY